MEYDKTDLKTPGRRFCPGPGSWVWRSLWLCMYSLESYMPALLHQLTLLRRGSESDTDILMRW
jgi:hypothetical protein